MRFFKFKTLGAPDLNERKAPLKAGGTIMHFQLDIQTIMLTLVIGNLLTVLLIAAYRFRAPQQKAVTFFNVSKGLQSACWLLVILREYLSYPPLVPLSNALILGGGLLEVLALLMLTGTFDALTKRYYTAITVVGTFSYGLIYFGQFPDNLRIVSTSVAASLFLAFPACRFIAGGKDSALQTLLGAVYGWISAVMLARACAAGFTGRDMNVFTPGFVQELYYLCIFLFMISGTAGFVLLSREKSYDELKKWAAYDELTGILNRRAFIFHAETVLADAAERGEPLSFLLLDIDHFKQVNDNYGHLTGDNALRSLAIHVRACLGPHDLFGRFGGEEFAILLPGADEANSEETAERIRRTIMESRLEGHSLRYTVSIGVITVIPARGTELDLLYKLSDAALYQAKHGGRNRVVRSRV